ncbi:MAG: hypothetical protein ACE5IH_10220, partial [Thermodesulfobacteriota bacterium]
LMVYHNRFNTAKGWIRTSAVYSVKTGNGSERTLVQKNLGEGLGLHSDESCFCIFRDHVSGMEYIRNSKELFEKGLYVELEAYKYHLFLDFYEVQDSERHQYAHLTAYLDGCGVPNIEDALREIFLRPLHHPFEDLVNTSMFKRLMDARMTGPDGQMDQEFINEVGQKTMHLLREIKQFSVGTGDETVLAKGLQQEMKVIFQLPVLENLLPASKSQKYKAVIRYLKTNLIDTPSIWAGLFSWLFVHSLGKIVSESDFEQQSRTWIDEWLFGRIINNVLQDIGTDDPSARQTVTIIKLLTSHQRWFEVHAPEKERAHQVLETLLKDDEIQQFLQVNRYHNVLWFNQEAFEQLLRWMMVVAVIETCSDSLRPKTEVREEIIRHYDIIHKLHQSGDESGYQVGRLLEIMKG